MKYKYKKAERLNSPACDQRKVNAFGIFNGNKASKQSQQKTLAELAQELEEMLLSYKALNSLFGTQKEVRKLD